MPVVRWPGGTYSLEYHWENAIGPLAKRPVTEDYAWKGKDNNRFGTDEFLQWCKEVGTSAYINFNMGNQPPYAGTLQEALDWIEYVNGAPSTPYGRKRADNGHEAPYKVKYWGIGNENYLPAGRHTAEKANAYAEKLSVWAGTIRSRYPDLHLLAVGHTYDWDKTVLDKCGSLIDLLTEHYYVTSRFKNNKIENPESTLFAPAKIEAHLQKLESIINDVNRRLGREDNPVQLCIDEWNNRHSVFDGKSYQFTRADPRRQLDAAVVASMLNVFIRQSPAMGMANYIFPVNGHGLVKTVGNEDAYVTPPYYVFLQYHKWMTGQKLSSKVEGPGVAASDISFNLHGDANEIALKNTSLPFVDAAAVMMKKGTINIALVNRSPDQSQKVRLVIPAGYVPQKKWVLASTDINAANTENKRNQVMPHILNLKGKTKDLYIIIPSCGINIIQCAAK